MDFSSNPLNPLIEALESQNVALGIARNAYLMLEAERKHFEATLINQVSGKSHAEKVSNAQSMAEWLEFHKKLGRAEAIFEFEKLKFSVLEKSWQSAYLQMKLDGGLIIKQG